MPTENFSSNPEQLRESIESRGLCLFSIDGFSENPEDPDSDAEVRRFLASIFKDSFESYEYESWPLKCRSDTAGENIVEDTRKDLLAHCDGILMENPPTWVCIFKSSQSNMQGDDISLLSSDALIKELGELGVSLEQLLTTKFPYNFPKFHKKYREDAEPRWIPFLKEEGGKYLTCYAPDVILRDLLDEEQLKLVTKIEDVILRLQRESALELPVGSGYLVSNDQYLHARNAQSLIDESTFGTRAVFRIRLYS